MVAMLPGAVAGAVAFVGLGASSAAVTTLAPTLNDVAQPLLLVSAVLLAVSGLRCSPIAVALAAAGGVLLYLGMYQLTRADGTTSATLFYPGLGCFFGAYLVAWRRRRGLRCRPLVSQLLAYQLLVGTLVAGVAVVVVAAATTGPASGRTNRDPGMRMPGGGAGSNMPSDDAPSRGSMSSMGK